MPEEGGRSKAAVISTAGAQARAANATYGTKAIRVASDLGGPEAEAAPARPGDEDVRVPLHRRDSGSGDRLRLVENLRQRGAAYAAMGIMLLFSPRPLSALRCDARTRHRFGRPSAPTPFSMPLPPRRTAPSRPRTRPSWATSSREANASCLSAARPSPGLMGPVQHDVTRRRQPEGFSAPRSLTASSPPLHQNGRLRLFCSLRPRRWCQQITVR